MERRLAGAGASKATSLREGGAGEKPGRWAGLFSLVVAVRPNPHDLFLAPLQERRSVKIIEETLFRYLWKILASTSHSPLPQIGIFA